MSKTYFPEDDEEILKYKRSYLDRELELAIEEEKICVTKAVAAYSEAKKETPGKHSVVVDQIIVCIGNKPYLICHMEQKLREATLIRELSQLERVKPKGIPQSSRVANVTLKPQHIKRDLFSRPASYF